MCVMDLIELSDYIIIDNINIFIIYYKY